MKEKPKIKCPVIDIQPFSYRPLYCTVVEDDGISKMCGSLFISYFFTLSTGTGHRRANGTSFFLFKDKSIAWGLCFDWINYISSHYSDEGDCWFDSQIQPSVRLTQFILVLLHSYLMHCGECSSIVVRTESCMSKEEQNTFLQRCYFVLRSMKFTL